MDKLPLIVDIKRHSLEDGPGIRSVVFFKGCPLRCIFCHSPETQEPGLEIGFFPGQCIRCESCVEACPQEAIDLELPGRIHREKCLHCGTCASVCPGKGLRLIGTYYSVETLGEILLRDLPFYRHSDGGVTLSGGECTLYPDYLEPLLKRLKGSGVHLAMQTSGYFDYPSVKKKILPYMDLIQYDIKLADPENHKRYLGKSNRRIFNNLRRLIQKENVEVHPRVPLVPGITATELNLSAIIDILCELGIENVSLLPYNPMGIDMAVSLGREKPTLPERFMTPDEESEIYTFFSKLLEEKGIRSSKDRKGRGIKARKLPANNKPASMSFPS
ncbi:MAG: glycyl-radical enzyme activating protein [Syntrophobacterales bacterium]